MPICFLSFFSSSSTASDRFPLPPPDGPARLLAPLVPAVPLLPLVLVLVVLLYPAEPELELYPPPVLPVLTFWLALPDVPGLAYLE